MSKAFPITHRELERAWRDLRRSSQVVPRCNSHRLLIVYAVECGLKAVWLRRQHRNLFEGQDIDRFGHDLNEILRELKPGRQFEPLPVVVKLKSVKPVEVGQAPRPRSGGIEALHQAWRYGAPLMEPSDEAMELHLERVAQWIAKELQ
jgi:hypothetical protein